MTTIGGFALSACASLALVSIPTSVTCICHNAFYESANLTSISIPASVTSISNYVFYGCSNLATVTLNSNPFIGDYASFPASATVTMNLTANSAGNAKWMTFYNQNYSFEADANTQVFKVALSGKGDLTMNKVDNRIVDAGTAVVLKTTGGGNPVMTLTTTASGDEQANSLIGVASPGVETSDGTMFVLNNGSQGVGFYRLTSGKTLGVGKAYLIYDDSNPEQGGSFAREFFGFGDTTGINDVRGQKEDVRGEYNDLQGRRVSQPTKGLYIVNGKKVVIK